MCVYYFEKMLLILTFALPWKLKVNTYSPLRVSLCLTKKIPCPVWPCWRTSWAASRRDRVPWNHGYSCKSVSICGSCSKWESRCEVSETTNLCLLLFCRHLQYMSHIPNRDLLWHHLVWHPIWHKLLSFVYVKYFKRNGKYVIKRINHYSWTTTFCQQASGWDWSISHSQ